MPKSYTLTDDGLKILNCSNLREVEHVSFTSINPVAQALREFLVSGPALVPGLAVAGVCLQAQTFLNIYSPDAFYYTLHEAVPAIKAARPTCVSLTRAAGTVQRLIGDLVRARIEPRECIRALRALHDVLCEQIDHTEAMIRAVLDQTLPREGALVVSGALGSLHSVASGTLCAMLAARHNTGRGTPLVYSPVGQPLTENVHTVRELLTAGCPAQLTSDAGLPSVMLRSDVRAVCVLASCVCANGDVLAFSGAASAAVMAKELGVPVYVVVYPYCFDASYASGEEAPADPAGLPAYDTTITPTVLEPDNDLLPCTWISGYVTAHGLIKSGADLKPHMDTADGVMLSALEAVQRRLRPAIYMDDNPRKGGGYLIGP